MQLPCRKYIRLHESCYGVEGAVFHIVIRTQNSRPLFSDKSIANLLFAGIMDGHIARESDLFGVCLMPDHVHLLQGVIEVNLIDLIRRWKIFTTNRLHAAGISGVI